MVSTAVIRVQGPFDLRLSLEAAAAFLPIRTPPPPMLRLATCIRGKPAVVEIGQPHKAHPLVIASSSIAVSPDRLERLARWLVSADCDLRPFYRIAAPHPVLGPVAKALRGFKLLRPESLFEMSVIAITEQQLSLAAAFWIRTQLINRFGLPIGDLRAFPQAETVANTPLDDLMSCGLSRRKAEYVKSMAHAVTTGALTLDDLTSKSDAEARAALVACRGLGAWSAQYILLRGLGRLDCLPADDVGLRRAAGNYLSHGRRLSPGALERLLAPFAPFRGLAAFYMAAHARLRRDSDKVRRGRVRKSVPTDGKIEHSRASGATSGSNDGTGGLCGLDRP